jgi:hypothetical protein
MEKVMDNVVEFPTPRERAGVSMLEDMDMLLDALVGAALALQHSENVAEDDREGDVAVMTELLVKYFGVRGERFPEDSEEDL